MNPEKVGKFIIEMRKKQGLTQEQLAETLSISNKTISRWETGKAVPDISFLRQLSDVLGVTIEELLNGEKNYNTNNIFKKKNNKKRVLNILFTLVVLIILTFNFLFIKNNYNNCHIYSISSKNSDFVVKGIFINTMNEKIISISSVENAEAYDLDLVDIYAYEYRLYYDATLVIGKGSDISNIEIDEYSRLQPLNDIFEEIKIYIPDVINYIDSDFSKINNDSLKLEILYLDNNEEIKRLEIPITIEKIFSNNQII